jgi:ribonuclease P protein component
MRKPRAGRGAQAAAACSSRFPARPLDQPHGSAVAAPERLRRRADFLRAAKGMRFFARGLTLQAAPRPIPAETMEARAPGDPAIFGAGTGPAQTGNPLDILPWAEAQPRFGFTVTKQSGGAVRRNRIRRRLKEALRLLNPLPARPGHDYVILARPEALGMPFLALQGELMKALGKIAARKDQPPIHKDIDREGAAAGQADAARRQSSIGQSSKGRNPKG